MEENKKLNWFRSAMEFIVLHYDHAIEKEESYEVYFKVEKSEVVWFNSFTNDMWNMIFCKNCEHRLSPMNRGGGKGVDWMI